MGERILPGRRRGGSGRWWLGGAVVMLTKFETKSARVKGSSGAELCRVGRSGRVSPSSLSVSP